MTNYPSSLDNTITLPGVSGSSQEDIAISALRDATFAIEKELGITPSGIYSDVRARLDILESRINFSIPPNIPNDGYVNSPLIIQNINSSPNVTLTISDGYGFPTENRVNGSIYMRGGDGYANNQIYVRVNGVWKPIQTDQFTASGDLSGNYLSQTVIGLQGKSLSTALTTIGAAQDGYRLTWNNSTSKWEAQTGFIAGNDLSGTRVSQTVIGIQGKAVSSIAPVDGYSLVWVAADTQWEPQIRPIIFDGYATRANLRSNKFLQSPIDNTKTGIVNFGSRSSGSSPGTTNNYATILSGDRGTASGNFGLIVAGDLNTASAQYSAVINGISNTASGQYSFVLDGYSNIASGINSFITNGQTNQANANGSYILNGTSNTIDSNSSEAIIFGGDSNTITNGAESIIFGGANNSVTSTTSNCIIGSAVSSSITGGSHYSNILGGFELSILGSSPYSNMLSGFENVINVSSPYSTIISGAFNIINSNSSSGFIASGSANQITGNYSTVLTGTTNIISGGSSNVILTGNSNTISSGINSIILDGYSNTISNNYSLITTGFNNTINGQSNTIMGGSLNSISGNNSIITNGSNNSTDGYSNYVNMLFGNGNAITTSSNVLLSGFNNSISTSTSLNIVGDSNIVTGSTISNIFGQSNQARSGNNNSILGSNNLIDGYSNSKILGNNNLVVANYGLTIGQYGKSRMFGQEVHANSRFTSGKIGESQWSKLILTGSGNSGAAITLQLQDSSPVNPTFVDGYSYEMSIRVLVVNTAPISPNPVVPARYVFDILAHQESGTLVLDNINQTLITPQSSGTPWTVTISVSTNQLLVTVDSEAGPPYVQPSNTPSSRRAIATIEMREISRL